MTRSVSAVTLEQPATEIGIATATTTTTSDCFHCGLPVLPGTRLTAVVDGQEQPMCCAGCKAVAEAIVAAELTDFYRHRTAPARRPEELIPEQLRGLAIYDLPDVQQSFVRREDGQHREAALILEGIVCAACVWLNEHQVSHLPGVLEFRVNYSTHRARVRWDADQIQLSAILGAIAAIGYTAHPFDPSRQEALHQRERAIALRRLAVAGLGSMQVMMLAVGLYVGEYQDMEAWIRQFLQWISLVLATPVVGYAAQPFFKAAWRDLRHRQLGMDVPVALAVLIAFVASIWHTVQGTGEVYYDSVTMFVFFLLTGRFLEMSARHRTAQISEALVRLLPASATRLRADDTPETVPSAELVPGDRVLVRPGETIPADGCIVDGISSVDESLLTGESLPLPRKAGEGVTGGAVNVDSPVVVRIEKVGADTVLSAIARLLDRAQSEKPRLALLADRIAAHFVAVVLVIAAGVFLAWWHWGDFDTAFRITLSVLVVTCPCALSLATPAALTAATGALTRLGLLTTRGHALETLAQATHIIFDKTGTLTLGRLQVTTVRPVRALTPDRALALAAALERSSEHPAGRALVEAAAGLALPAASEIRNTPGGGIEGWIDGQCYRAGRPEFVAELSEASQAQWPFADDEQADAAQSWVALGDAHGLIAWFSLSDTVRPDARAVVAGLKARGFRLELLSGDRPETVAHVARTLGIEAATGGMSPHDKLGRLRALQAQGAVAAMVGDGINDAPVLAAAQVSLAMGGGAQLAHATADFIVLSEKLEHLLSGIDSARRTLRIMRQNFAWAIGYNIVALPLAASGGLTPWMSAIGMSFSSLLVVVNALRLRQRQS